MTDSETDTIDPVHVLWGLTLALIAAAVVFFIVSAVAFNPSGYTDDPDDEQGYVTLIIGAVFLAGSIVPWSAGLVARSVRR